MDSTITKSPTGELQLNLFEFAQRGQQLAGSVELADLPRLAASACATPEQLRQLQAGWQLRGWVRQQPGAPDQPMLELRVQAELPLLCQRCLQPALLAIEDQALFRLVEQEPELTMDELEADDEALCVQGATDLLPLIEDQLILALPLVPMHDSCPQPLPRGQQEQPLVSPFAVLAGLKRQS